MIRKLALSFIFVALMVPATLFAGDCTTKYPVVLCHGIAMSNNMASLGNEYFYGVASPLRGKGCTVYATKVDCMNTKEVKAQQVTTQILQILAVTGKSKVNIIGHSDGSLYTRLAISNYGLASKVASHTSVNGPHRGSPVADWVAGLIPKSALSLVGATLDWAYIVLFGDKSASSVSQVAVLTTKYMTGTFNPNVPNASGIYYQSWTSRIKTITADLVLEPTYLALQAFVGDNDGVVPVSSAKWGNFRGTMTGSWWCGGISHLNVTGQFFGVTPGFSAPDFYIDVVKDLKSRGY